MNPEAFAAMMTAQRAANVAADAKAAAQAAWDAAAPNAADMVWQAACADVQARDAAAYAARFQAR